MFGIYMLIGVIVEVIVMIERAIRLPELWDDFGVACKLWQFWAVLIGCFIVNVISWPATIVFEIVNIRNRI